MSNVLKKPFGVKEPQSLEKNSQAVFYEKVFETDVQPKLTKIGRGWKIYLLNLIFYTLFGRSILAKYFYVFVVLLDRRS